MLLHRYRAGRPSPGILPATAGELGPQGQRGKPASPGGRAPTPVFTSILGEHPEEAHISGMRCENQPRESPAGSPEVLCSPQSSGARPLISDGPRLFSSFSQETATFPSAASWQMETQEHGEDERGMGQGGQGWKLLPGKPSLLRPLGRKSDAQPCLRGKCASSGRWGWSMDRIILSARRHLCLPPLMGLRRGRGRAQPVSARRPSPWSCSIQPRRESLYVSELVNRRLMACTRQGMK